MFSVCTVSVLVLLVLSVDGNSTLRTHCSVPLPDPVACGVLKTHPAGLFLREAEAIREEFPWHAAVYRAYNGAYICGGSLVHERFVLTAASCVLDHNEAHAEIKVKLGLHELHDDDECVQELSSKKIHVHDKYSAKRGEYDIALIELSNRVTYTWRVLPVCLDTSEKEEPNFYDQMGKLPGWGNAEYSNASAWLRMAYLPLVSYAHCLESNPGVFAFIINEGFFCAGYVGGTGVCHGDSGGGLVTYDSDRYVIRGVLSFTALRDGDSTSCNTEHYAGLTKVRFYRKWLQKTIQGTIPASFA